MMPDTRTASTARRAGATLLLAALAWAAAPAAAQLESPDSGMWITLGADAFATLVADGLRFGGLPLQRFGEGAGAVLTRVERRDLLPITERLHTVHRRCPGFVVHRSAAEGLDALATLERLPEAAAVPDFTIDQGPVVTQLQAAVAEPPILNSILRLSTDFNNRFYAHPSGVAAAHWIRDLWQGYAAGRPDVSVELFDHGWPQPSVILTLDGAEVPDEIVILGGHLDSIASGWSDPDFLAPGADDNASGIAVLSEVVRVALSEGFRPRRTVQFIGYAAEELGLWGSDEIAEAYQTAGLDVVAVLQLDMTDYHVSTEDVALIDDYVDPGLTSFLGALLDVYQPELLWTTTSCGYACSDHASWSSRGFDAAFPFEAPMSQSNPWIHTTSDTLAMLGYSVAHAAKFARLATAFMVETAKSHDALLFADGFESGTTGSWFEVVP